MEMILGIAAAVLALLCIALFVRSMELTSSHNELRDQVTAAQREAKKLKEQLSSSSSKLQVKSQEASRSSKSTKNQKQRLSQINEEFQRAKNDAEKYKERVKELTQETDRLRIAREELRGQLAKASVPASAPAAQPQEPLDAPAPAPAAAAPAERPVEEKPMRSPTAVERDLERAHQDLDRLHESHRSLKRRLVETTADLRMASRKNEHNRRAYMITQLQLDLAQDEVYTLKHGRPPEMPRAEKAKKRASLKPVEEQVEVNREAGTIELPDVDALEAENERIRQEERAARAAEEAERLEAEALAEAEEKAIMEAEVAAQAADEAAAQAAEAAAEEAAQAEAAQASEAEETPAKQSGPVRRRRSSTKVAESGA